MSDGEQRQRDDSQDRPGRNQPIGPELAAELVRTYLNARFSDIERHRRRVGKVELFEEEFGVESPVAAGRAPD